MRQIEALLASWKKQRDQFEAMSETFPSDLTTIQYVVYASHITELERVLES